MEFPWIAAIVSGVLAYGLGALWYSPLLFGNSWMAAMGKSPDDMIMSPKLYAICFVTWLLAGFMFTALVVMTGYTNLASLICIAIVGFLGFTVVPIIMANIFEGTRSRVSMISGSYHLSAYLLMALVNWVL